MRAVIGGLLYDMDKAERIDEASNPAAQSVSDVNGWDEAGTGPRGGGPGRNRGCRGPQPPASSIIAAARVKERYPREALATALRILGEGQLSLTKCLFVTDADVDLRDFACVLRAWLERADFRTDVLVLGETAMDTLDYTGPMVNRGSKAVFLGTGERRRDLPCRFSGDLPPGLVAARPFVPGCLVLAGKPYVEYPGQAGDVAREPAFGDWPLLVLVDDLVEATASPALFVRSVFTRFEPAGDLYARKAAMERFHAALEPPLVFDARLRPSYPPVLEADAHTKALVDRRWPEYGL